MVATAAPEQPGTPSLDEVQLAMFMQARDARGFGITLDGVVHPQWSDVDYVAQQEYISDARAYLDAMRLLGWRKP